MRNSVAHYLLTKGEPAAPLHTSDGISYNVCSCAAAALLQCCCSAAAVLLHYGVSALQELSSFFRQHLNSRVSRGSVLPMVAQRDRYRVVVRMSRRPREDGTA